MFVVVGTDGERRENRVQQRIPSNGAFVVGAHRGLPAVASANGKGHSL